MQWINYFSTSKIPFYIYKLKKGDSIIYKSNTKNNKSIIILHGIIYILKIFTNQEILTLGILNKGNIISYKQETQYHYYNAVAMEETFILSFRLEDAILNQNIKKNLLQTIIQSHQSTLYKYEIMNSILAHKYTKHRIIQLILFLSTEFGLVEKNHIIIPFYLSQKTISIIIGSNRSTVNKIMHKLYQNNAISYSNQKYICIKNLFILSYSNEKYHNNK